MRSNPTLVIVVIFLITILLATYDPLNVNPKGIEGDSLLVGIYVLPAFVSIVYMYVLPYFKK